MDIAKITNGIQSDINSNVQKIDTESNLKVWAIVRNSYRKIALDAYKCGNYDKAILYDTKALSCGFVGERLNNNSQRINELLIDNTIYLQQKSSNSLMDFLSACINDVKINESHGKKSTIETDDKIQFDDLCTKCSQLPKQWNVLQISQMYNGYNGYATKKDLYTSDAPVKFTLFRNAMSGERFNHPFSIVLDWFELGDNSILSMAQKINQVMYKDYTSAMKADDFTAFIIELTQMQSKLVNDVINWLGPWVVLFSGKVKETIGKEWEETIFAEVDTFCNKLDIFFQENLLLKLIARRIDLLDTEKIQRASNHLARTHNECKAITQFLANLKSKTANNQYTYYPCILVIDEILDPLPWEFVHTSQEFSRVHSIYLLFYLYEKYSAQIVDGYYKLNVKQGFALINPDSDEKLNDMLKRCQQYYSDIFPSWERVERTIPTFDQMRQGLSQSDLFVYSGHGSTLQFFTSLEFEALQNNCVMFLFGCESVAMKPQGTICEAACTTYTYFKTGCPAILGTLTIVTDVWIDLVMFYILTQWAAPRTIKHPLIDISKDSHTIQRVNRILSTIEGKRNPNLLQLLCDIRNQNDISIRIRHAMVFRGLPSHNVGVENEATF